MPMSGSSDSDRIFSVGVETNGEVDGRWRMNQGAGGGSRLRHLRLICLSFFTLSSLTFCGIFVARFGAFITRLTCSCTCCAMTNRSDLSPSLFLRDPDVEMSPLSSYSSKARPLRFLDLLLASSSLPSEIAETPPLTI